MLDIENTLVHKLSLNISCMAHQDSRNISDIIKQILFSEIEAVFQLDANWKTFAFGGSYSSQDHSFTVCASSLISDDDHGLWAAVLILKDPSYTRRSWKYYFGINQLSKEESYFCYAKCYHDHTAGSMGFPKPVSVYRDAFPDCLFYDRRLQVRCGNLPLLVNPVELTHETLNLAMDYILDKERSLPLMINTCPDVISPEQIQDIALGNMMIWWCADFRIMEELNRMLPKDLQTQWDSIRIILPVSGSRFFHPSYSYKEIHQMGIETFYNGIRQAYCRSLRSDERKRFITVSDVSRNREQLLTDRLIQQIGQQHKQMNDLSELLDQRNAALQEAERRLKEYDPQRVKTQIAEYETVLTDAFAETDALKQGISDLSTQLYSTMGKAFKPDNCTQIPLLQELAHAIYSSLACIASRR